MDGSMRKKTQYGEAGVADMALRREERAREQRMLLDGDPLSCVVCFTLNTAGPVKRSGIIDRVFFAAAERLVNAIMRENMPVRIGKLVQRTTGDELLLSVRGSAEKVKRICMTLEEEKELGRLFDMDVIGQNGRKIGRSTPRKCLICSENAAICARSRTHSVSELQNKTAELIKAEISWTAAELAYDALITEVNVTPKAGLVDGNNSGANPDMDVPMFERSAAALRPFFYRIALAVLESGEHPLTDTRELSSPALAKELRRIGVEAERAMLRATGGVNTHRGAVWSVGILTAAYAYCAAGGSVFETDGAADLTELILRSAAELANNLGDGTADSSKGAQVRKKFGVSGPVEQAKAGFPLARLALEQKKEYYQLKAGEGFMPDPWAYALLAVMAELDDNNALRRGGKEGAAFVKARARELLIEGRTIPGGQFLERLLDLDRELTERRISCGGAADMLAAAIFLCGANERFFMRSERFIREMAGECAEQI